MRVYTSILLSGLLLASFTNSARAISSRNGESSAPATATIIQVQTEKDSLISQPALTGESHWANLKHRGSGRVETSQDARSSDRVKSEDARGSGRVENTPDARGSGRVKSEDARGSGRVENSEDARGSGRVKSEDDRGSGRVENNEDARGSGRVKSEDDRGSGRVEKDNAGRGSGRVEA